jgi:hypothetical protein
MELEAESTAYVICAALGMDTSDYSFGYVAGWAGGAPEAVQGIKASTSRIQRATSAVLRNFEAEVDIVELNQSSTLEVAIAREVPNRESSQQVVDTEAFLRLSGNCEFPSAVEFAVPDSPVQFERHLGD